MKTFWRALWEGLACIGSFGTYPPRKRPLNLWKESPEVQQQWMDRMLTDEDRAAIASDWAAVGGDMRRAIDKVAKEIPTHPATEAATG